MSADRRRGQQAELQGPPDEAVSFPVTRTVTRVFVVDDAKTLAKV